MAASVNAVERREIGNTDGMAANAQYAVSPEMKSMTGIFVRAFAEYAAKHSQYNMKWMAAGVSAAAKNSINGKAISVYAVGKKLNCLPIYRIITPTISISPLWKTKSSLILFIFLSAILTTLSINRLKEISRDWADG